MIGAPLAVEVHPQPSDPIRLGIAGAIAGLLLAGCSQQAAPGATLEPATATEASAQLMSSRTAVGGLCPEGPCQQVVTLYSDGDWVSESEDPGAARAGKLTRAELEEWHAALDDTRLATMPAQQGPCPRDYDGQEIIYFWDIDGSPHSVSSCEYVLDDQDPLVLLFRSLDEEIGL